MNRTVAFAVSAFVFVGILIAAGQLAFIGLLVQGNQSGARAASGATGSTRIECSPVESLDTHYHVALRIHQAGGVDVLPAYTGIGTTCLYWIHVHDNSGIVHIEAPAAYQDHVFVLADVFGVAGERLDASHLGSTSYPGGGVAVYVDGKRWAHAPGALPLVDLETIDVVAPGESFSYRPFAWPGGFGTPPTV
jgi:hypothetical protein